MCSLTLLRLTAPSLPTRPPPRPRHRHALPPISLDRTALHADWDEKDTYAASLAAKAGGATQGPEGVKALDSLWQDDWDDDDVGDDFSVQLRCVRAASLSRGRARAAAQAQLPALPRQGWLVPAHDADSCSRSRTHRGELIKQQDQMQS